MEELRNEGMLIAYTDLGRRDSKQQLADALTHAIYGGLFAPFERAMRRATAAFQHLAVRPKVTIGLDGAPTFEFAASERSKDLDQTLEQLLEIPARVAKDRKRPVAIVLDEFQKVMDIDPQLPATLRSVFQFQATVSHVYLGSRQHLMTKVFIDENAA